MRNSTMRQSRLSIVAQQGVQIRRKTLSALYDNALESKKTCRFRLYCEICLDCMT
jgi:hypothetical protein